MLYTVHVLYVDKRVHQLVASAPGRLDYFESVKALCRRWADKPGVVEACVRRGPRTVFTAKGRCPHADPTLPRPGDQ